MEKVDKKYGASKMKHFHFELNHVIINLIYITDL